jgi:hypothetical protein
VPSGTAETAPTKRDVHLRCIAERGRMGWQRASGYGWRALVEADISRWKRVVGDGPRHSVDPCNTVPGRCSTGPPDDGGPARAATVGRARRRSGRPR